MAFKAWSRFDEVCKASKGRPAVFHGSASFRFDEIARMGLDWGATLKASPGERVVLYTDNSVTAIAALLGIWRCGAIPVWVNADAPLDHLRMAAQETSAVAIVSLKPDLPDDLSCPVISSAATNGEATCSQTGMATEIGSIVYTSGSSGHPKGVVQRVDTLIDGAARVAQFFNYRPSDRILCPVPFAFDYGWGQLLSLLFEGITLVLPEPANAFGLCDAIIRNRPTIFAGVPAVFANLLNGMSPIRETDVGSIRLITNTGSRIPLAVQDALSQVFPDAGLSLNYGLTETYRSASLPVDLAKVKPHSVGHAFLGTDIVVLTADGRPCAQNEVGEIVHRGAGTFDGYWNDTKRTSVVRRPDPLDPHSGEFAVFTGDLGYLDEQGHLAIVGRQDRQLKSMGVRVSPDEIEQIMLATGLLTDVAVTSRKEDTIGDMIVAFIVHRNTQNANSDLKQLKQELRTRLSRYMTPRIYKPLEALPRNHNGKVDYPKLKVLAGEQMP